MIEREPTSVENVIPPPPPVIPPPPPLSTNVLTPPPLKGGEGVRKGIKE